MSGFVLIHRTLLGHHAFRNDAESMAFAWMILRASWRDTKVRYKGRSIALSRGQLAVSIRDMAEALDRPKGWVERFLTRAKDGTMVRTDSGTGVLIITICNYDIYQAQMVEGGTVGETATGQTQDSDRTQNKEGNKRTKENKGAYAFCGSVIRLNERDFQRWQKAYPRLDLTAALQSRDDWLAAQPAERKKDWFHSTSSWLARKQQEASAISDAGEIW